MSYLRIMRSLEGLTEISQVTSNLTDESNAIMDQVADIVALSHLNDSGVQDGVKNARMKQDDTVTDLNEFDSTQTNALSRVEADLLMMVSGKFKEEKRMR